MTPPFSPQGMSSAMISFNLLHFVRYRPFLKKLATQAATTELYIGGFCPSVRMWSIPTISSRLARPPHLFFNHNLQMCVCVCTHTVCVPGKHPELKRISEGTLLWSKQQNPAYWEILTHRAPTEMILQTPRPAAVLQRACFKENRLEKTYIRIILTSEGRR